jgi:hypothetical protein
MSDQTPENMTEKDRRDLAFANRGRLSAEPGAEIEPRRLPQMVSLRLDADIVATLRDIAGERGVSVSDLLREGADQVISRWTGNRGRVAHVSWTSSAFPGRALHGDYEVVIQSYGAFPSYTQQHGVFGPLPEHAHRS